MCALCVDNLKAKMSIFQLADAVYELSLNDDLTFEERQHIIEILLEHDDIELVL